MSAVPLHESAAGSDIAQLRPSGKGFVPIVVCDIEAGAGGNELLDHERVTLCCGRDERRPSAHELAAGSDSAQPLQSSVLVRTQRCP